MKTWSMEFTAGEKSLAEAKIKRGIFQGEALSPLLFIIAMMPLNHIHRNEIKHRKMGHVNSKKGQSTPYGRNATTKSIQN